MIDQMTGDDRADALPDGTDTVLEGAARTGDGDTDTVEDTALVAERKIPHRAALPSAPSPVVAIPPRDLPTASATAVSSLPGKPEKKRAGSSRRGLSAAPKRWPTSPE